MTKVYVVCKIKNPNEETEHGYGFEVMGVFDSVKTICELFSDKREEWGYGFGPLYMNQRLPDASETWPDWYWFDEISFHRGRMGGYDD